ncbi:ATP-dependent RNA helicase ddx58 [Branchiostoma belcheri]|nr:ATP-dependent RNA helicase ddx58 [Branchiostoma belcheri]
MASGGPHSICVNSRSDIKEDTNIIKEPILISRLTLSEENQVGDSAESESKVANTDSFKFPGSQTSTKLLYGNNADSDMISENSDSLGSESNYEDENNSLEDEKEALAIKVQNDSSLGLQSGNPPREGSKMVLCRMENGTSDTDSCTSLKEVINQTEQDHVDITDTDQTVDDTPMPTPSNFEQQEDTSDNENLQQTPCRELAVDLLQEGSGGSKTYERQLIITDPSTRTFDGATIQIDEAVELCYVVKATVKNSSGVQLGRDNIVLRRETSNNLDTGDTGTLSNGASESPFHSSNKEQHSFGSIRIRKANKVAVIRDFEFESCHGMQFGDNNVTKMVDPEDSTESNPDLVNVCLDLDINDRDEDDMYEKLGNEDCRREFCRRLASRGGANCELEEARRGCILLKMKVPTEQDRLRLIQMAKDGTFKEIFLETFLPDYAKRGKDVRVNLAIAVTNPSQEIVDEMKAPSTSKGHKDVVIVEVATGGPSSTPGSLGTLSASPLSASPQELDNQGASRSGANMDSHEGNLPPPSRQLKEMNAPITDKQPAVSRSQQKDPGKEEDLGTGSVDKWRDLVLPSRQLQESTFEEIESIVTAKQPETGGAFSLAKSCPDLQLFDFQLNRIRPDGSIWTGERETDIVRAKLGSKVFVPSSAGLEMKAIPMCDYQMELAKPALEGRNTIICAPTGSGKTHVAIKITREHLEGGAGIDAQRRVAFLVNRVPLVEQKCNAFREYLSPNGETATDIPVGETLTEHDVIIQTAEVFENAQRDGLTTLDKFSMLIFDECHHCQKNDPYNAIMTRYIEQKWEKSGTRLPQIIGLTTSLGVGKSQKDAVEHILKSCAILDAEWLSQVVEHKDELLGYNQKRDEEAKMELQEYAADPKYSNPNLDQLKSMILQAYKEKPDSRCLLLCTTSALTFALLRWMQEDPELYKLNPGRLVFSTLSGSTKDLDIAKFMQRVLLEQFTQGHKIIITTPNTEKGMDIANFVFRYDYVGNEIGKVETRGCAEDSRPVLIARREGGTVPKEKTTQEKLMEKAMLQVWHMQRENHGDFMKEVRRLQLESKKRCDVCSWSPRSDGVLHDGGATSAAGVQEVMVYRQARFPTLKILLNS